MKKIILYFCALVFPVCFQSLKAQQVKVDSLEKVLQRESSDTTRLRLYIMQCEACDIKDNLKYAQPAEALVNKLLSGASGSAEKEWLLRRKAQVYIYFTAYYSDKLFQKGMASEKELEYYQKSFDVYKELNDQEAMKNALADISNYYDRQGNIMKRLECLQQGLLLFEKTDYKIGQARFIAMLAFFYADLGDTSRALDYLEKGMQLEKAIGDARRITKGMVILGDFYVRMHRPKDALISYQKALPRYKTEKDSEEDRASLHEKIGRAYEMTGDTGKAMEEFRAELDINQKWQHTWGIVGALSRIGHNYFLRGNAADAIIYHLKALELCEKNDLALGIAYVSEMLAGDYLLQKNPAKAKAYSSNYLELVKLSGIVPNICNAEKLQFAVDSALGNYKEALLHYRNYIALYNKLNDEEVHKAATREKFQSDYEKQKAVDKVEQDKKDLVVKNELQRQKIVRNSFVGGFICMLVLALFVYRSYRQKQKSNKELAQKNKEIEEKNKDILDSIRYAKRIQTSLLPTEKYIDKSLNRLFEKYGNV